MERKRTTKLRPHGEKKKTIKLRPHGEGKKKDYRWSQNPMEKRKATDKAKTPQKRKRLQSEDSMERKKDYRWSQNPTEKKKTTDKAKTPQRRKRLQSWDPTEKKRLQTKPKCHGEKKTTKTPDKVKTLQRRRRLQTRLRPHPLWSYPGRCGWARQSCSLSRCSSRGDRPVPGCSPLKHT